MQVRYCADQVRYTRMNTEELRGSFLVEGFFESGKLQLLYSDVDRGIIGSAVPTCQLVMGFTLAWIKSANRQGREMILEQFRLDGKTALVTGCKRGIGLAMLRDPWGMAIQLCKRNAPMI